MTFIASVVARDGIAVIADSLVTSEEPVITLENFRNFLEEKKIDIKKPTSISSDDLRSLFEFKPSYTRDFAEKLFPFDKHTIITTSGLAVLNNKVIKNLIEGFQYLYEQEKNKNIDSFLNGFKQFLKNECSEHIEKHNFVSRTSFIISHYNEEEKKFQIFHVSINPTSKSELEKNKDLDFIIINDATWMKAVFDGQSRIAFKLMFGSLYESIGTIVDTIVHSVCEKLGEKDVGKMDQITSNIIDEGVLLNEIKDDLDYQKIRELSLQEAIDYANLLMNLVMEFEKYTAKIPTVGGQIKLVALTKDGIKYIKGFEYHHH
jgi:20S proteasome alpha/beta subunit